MNGLSPLVNWPDADDPVNWPEPDRNYIGTCRSCDMMFFGPKRARCCHACYLDGQERRRLGEAAYDEKHKEPQYGWDETSLSVYREGWISGWITAKYPKP